MDQLFNVSEHTIVTSKSGHSIPIINNISLHSQYDPMREADSFCKSYLQTLKTDRSFLILGLGFGYHVLKLCQNFVPGPESLDSDINFFVIEPNTKNYQEFLRNKPVELPAQVKILSYEKVSSYFFDLELVSFLLKKPRIISHPASFNLYSGFFREFLSFEMPESVESSKYFLQNSELKNYIEKNEYFPHIGIDPQLIPQDKIDTRDPLSFLLLAFNHLS